MDTVLIADRDLGFVFWLAQRLNQLGHHALPAMSIDHAETMAEQFEFSILVIDPSLPDSSAFLEGLRRTRRRVKVLPLPSNSEDRSRQLRRLETILRTASRTRRSVQPITSLDFQLHPELPPDKLAGSRAALTGVLLGAALWAVLLVLVAPK